MTFFITPETIDRVINGYPVSYTKNFMQNFLIFQKNFIYLALTLILGSVFLIFNFQTTYSQIPEVSYLDVNDTSSVSKFSVAAWFKTSANYDSDAFIVNKPGSSNNLNYGIWMTSDEKLRGGFETSGGSPMYATSPQSYSDGMWHYVTVTYDGSDIILYVDGVQVATKKTSGSPDMGDEPVRVGADSTTLGDYFIGNVDEIRVWSVALTPTQVSDAYHDNADTKYQELYLDFSEPIESLNVTSVALNQTALNQTDILLTNDTAMTNDTLTQVNVTLPNQTGILPPASIENDTGIDNETSTNIPLLQEIPDVNETGITNETQDNQSTTLPPEENNSPEAFDQNISVDMDGQVDITFRATDEDNDPLKFDITADPLQGTLTNLDGEKGTATYVPQQGYSGSDQFQFRVIDDKGFESNVAQVDITVEESQSNETEASDLTETEGDTTNETMPEQSTGTGAFEQTNQPPNADAGNDISAEVNTQVELDGSQSTDEDGQIVSYKWEQTGGPEINLEQSNEQTASFDVPESAADSKLTFKLTVVDDKDASDSDDASVQVKTVENQPPKADAGGDKNAEVNTEGKLDGSKSSDEDGEIVSYKWEQTDGPKVDLKNADEQTASFDVPESAADSKLKFKLTVVDDKDASDSDNTTVEIQSVPQESDEESNSNGKSD
ncbi:MAG TPA: LamG-like jellyroll fold domain-containing protein [Nitrososphaeraceae archaeon]|nr:LamG-like jellyroll fold domain-containing protein [Nitrososphaeraceae archaeon]